MTATIPTDIESVTPEWLSAALGSEVLDVEIDQIGEGVGLLSYVFRLRLTLPDGSELPSSVIAKLPSTLPNQVMVATIFEIWEREVAFYRDLASATDMRVPEAYVALVDREQHAGVLLLEDVPGEIWEPGALTIEHVTAILQSLADLHGSFWRGANGGANADVPRFDAPMNRTGFGDGYVATWPLCRDAFEETMPEGWTDVGEMIGGSVVRIQEMLSEQPTTTLHGDARLDNYMFDGDDVVAVDWQGVVLGRAGFDVGYFLLISLPPELRRSHLDDMLDVYLDALHARGVDDYSRDDLMRDVRLAALYAGVYAVMATQTDLTSERARTVVQNMLDRAYDAVVDLDATALLTARV